MNRGNEFPIGLPPNCSVTPFLLPHVTPSEPCCPLHY
jgi:hypothetical protein